MLDELYIESIKLLNETRLKKVILLLLIISL